MNKSPVFILGINPRSGTNYLFRLLSEHPDCVASKHYGEDFIVYGADLLLAFIRKVTTKWASDWNNDPNEFYKSMQAGIMDYLDPGNNTARYVITKTPDASHADLFLQTFVSGKMILITRRGQDLTESFLKTFKGRFDDAVRGWTNGARWISAVINNREMMASNRIMCIRYEDLYNRNKEVMTDILKFLDLDISAYDFARSENYDVIGSSTFKGDSEKVTWDPVKKDKNFNPLNKFAHWSRFRHYRFNWLAGKYNKEFGYENLYDSGGPLYLVFNLFAMTYDFVYRTARRIVIYLKSRFL